MSAEVLVEIKNDIAWVTLNRPEVANAFSIPMIETLVSEMHRLDRDEKIKVIVVTGAGQHFCSGGDVKAMKNKEGMFAGEPDELRRRYEFGIQQIPKMMDLLQTPVIAMMNGHAIGAGLDFSLMCDLRYCARTAKVGETFVKLGLVPGDGGVYFLIRAVGFAKATEMALTGRVYSADEALEMGLVHKTFESAHLQSEVEKVAAEIAANAPTAVAMTKKALRASYRESLSTVLDLLSSYQGITQRTQEHFDRLK